MLDKVYDKTSESPQVAVDDWLYSLTEGYVQSGPFTGMKLLRETSWKDACLAPMLLGTWEQELHKDLEIEIKRLSNLSNPKIAVVGCAEGYYAVGLAGRLPLATVWAVDIDQKAIRITLENGLLNDVIITTGSDLIDIFSAPDLIVMDCEGSETAYLNLKDYPSLAKATIIVEIHNIIGMPPTVEVISDRFNETHIIKNISEGSRDPNAFNFLLNTHSALRWMCVCENRPCVMNWFVMRPKDEAATSND